MTDDYIFKHAYAEPEPQCPAVLKHPFYPAWTQLAILVLEAFFAGMILGKLL